ncbi:MAG: hypothetical protein HC896_09690 [Bacteroidales bacterium]|nr:hypothetical protein [Bacteroidales bacterium]
MKNLILLSVMLIATVVMVNAQTMVADGESDTVVVGAQMPYAVTPDANVALMVGAGILDASQFDWTLPAAGGAIDMTAAGTGLFVEDSITVTWGAAPGSYSVSVAENSMRAGAPVCADPTPSTITVEAVALPTLNVTGTDAGDCAEQDYNVPLSLTGYGPWDITYNIDFAPLSGAPGNVATGTVKSVGGEGDDVGTTATAFNLPILATELTAGSAGTYTVTVTNMDDRISNKALNGAAINGTLATATYTIYVYPTPGTGAIRHVEN